MRARQSAHRKLTTLTHATDRPRRRCARPAEAGHTCAVRARPQSDRLSGRCASQKARRGEKPAPAEHRAPTGQEAARRPPRLSGAAEGSASTGSRGRRPPYIQTVEPNRGDGREGGYKVYAAQTVRNRPGTRDRSTRAVSPAAQVSEMLAQGQVDQRCCTVWSTRNRPHARARQGGSAAGPHPSRARRRPLCSRRVPLLVL